MLLVDHPTSFGGNVLQRPAQIDGIQAKLGEWVCLVFHLLIMLYRPPGAQCLVKLLEPATAATTAGLRW